MKQLTFNMCCLAIMLGTSLIGGNLWAMPDPTQPPAVIQLEQSGGSGALNLAGIYTQNPQNKAVIAGRIVQSGDKIKGFKVVRIGANDVILTNENGDKRHLKLTSDWKQTFNTS